MATAQQLKALFKSYAEGDGDHFMSVALQIAAHAARNGKAKLAQELKSLLDEVKLKQAKGRIGGAVPIARPSGELAGLLSASYPKTKIAEMVIPSRASDQLKRVLREYRNQEQLRSHGLSARRKLLLVGPPGTGKTMTAWALAGEFKLPLFSVQVHGLISKFMGETAAKLHLIFEAMNTTRGVYLFDEFDAIGASRGSTNDVGEIRRVLNSFLQFLEQDQSDSVVVAATNYVEMLDDALFRRFDDVVQYSLPQGQQIGDLIKNRLTQLLAKRVGWTKVERAAKGLSHAQICRACDDAAKDCILEGAGKITTDQLVQVIKERHEADSSTHLS